MVWFQLAPSRLGNWKEVTAMTVSLAALLAATATYTAPVAGISDPLAVPAAPAKPGTVKVTANVTPVKLITDGAPVKRPAKGTAAAPSSNAATDKVEAAPRVAVEGEPSGSLPVTLVPGTYDARRFMAAWRHAKTRSEQITALSGYKGYDFRRDFSEQEITAKMWVRKETVGIVAGADRNTVRTAQHTAEGYVKGLPNPALRLLQDLLGRERDIIATMGEHLKIAQDEKKPREERAFSANAIKQGQALLQAIREEKAAMGAEDVEDMPADQR